METLDGSNPPDVSLNSFGFHGVNGFHSLSSNPRKWNHGDFLGSIFFQRKIIIILQLLKFTFLNSQKKKKA
jgi:hypothetical protein